MNPHPEGGRKRVTSRQWRFTQKMTSPPGTFPDYKSTSPKLNNQEFPTYKGSNKYLPRDSQKEFHESQTAEIQKLVSYLSQNRNQYPTLVGTQKVRSQEHLESPRKVDETQSVLKSIIHAGEEYRRELMRAQQRKAKGLAQNIAVKRQIDTVHKERESIQAENILLKSQKSLLQKELMIVRDNADRMKRKFQIELHQAHCEIDDIRKKNNELDDLRRQLSFKVEQMTKLQDSLKSNERQLSELQRLKNENCLLLEKTAKLDTIYNQLFQNYSRLEFHCQGLQKEVAITKTYLSNTQSQYSQNKEDNYRLQEERTRIQNETNKELLKKNSEIAIMGKKIQEQGVYLQAREKSIAELELVVGELTKKLNQGGQDNQKLKNELTTLQDKLVTLGKQSSLYEEHIKTLNESCKEQEINRHKNETILVKVYKQYGDKQIQWANILNNQLNNVTNEYEAKLFQLENIIQGRDLEIKRLESRSSQAEIECLTLKQICQKLKAELGEYSSQIKEKIDQVNTLKRENQDIETKKEEFSKLASEKQAKVMQLSEQNQSLREVTAELTETLKQREEDLVNFELQFKKQTQKITLMSEIHQKNENDSKNYNELIQRITASLNELTLKNAELSKRIIFREQQIKGCNLKIEQLKLIVEQKEEAIMDLEAQNQDFSQKLDKINKQKQASMAMMDVKDKDLIERQTAIKVVTQQMEKKKQSILFLQEQLKKVVEKQQSLKIERQSLSKMLGNKTSENQKLKLKLIQSEEALQNQYVMNIQTVKLEHQKSFKKLDSQKAEAVIMSSAKDDKINELLKLKDSLEDQLKTLRIKDEEHIKQIESNVTMIGAVENKLRSLMLEIEQKDIQIQNLKKDRQMLASLNQEKTKYAEKLKRELIVQEQELRQNFIQNYQKQSDKHQSELQKKIKENEACLSQLQIFCLYKTKCEELENQVFNLSEMLKIGRLNLDNERNKNRYLTEDNNMIRGSIKQIQEQLTARYEGQILSRSERFQREYSSLSQEKSELLYQSHNFKEEIDGIKMKLTEKDNKINSLTNELQNLKKRATNDIQLNQAEINELRRSNSEIGKEFEKLALQAENDRKQRDSLMNSAVTFQKSNNSIVEKIALLEQEFAEIQKLLNQLRDERQILIRKYIFLANETQKGDNNSAISREVDSIGQHFTQISQLHNEITKRLGSSKVLMGEVQKSKIMGLSVISSAIISQYKV